tara:strand:+ start:1209 stop:1367 length:159 start_codon:yes stop_codon:yes gene_type:complete
MPSYQWIKQHEEILELQKQLKMMERNVKELQEQLQKSYKRIGELTYKRDLPL